MLDPKWLRDYPELFKAGLERRGLGDRAELILGLELQRRHLQTELQLAQSQRNEVSKRIGELKRTGGNADDLLFEMNELKQTMEKLQQQSEQAESAFLAELHSLPNIPADDVPLGSDANDNQLHSQWGTPRHIAAPRDHSDLGEELGLLDFAAAAKISGARFAVLRGELARLERALGQFMLDIHTTEFGYTEINAPLLVRDEAAFGTGNLPKFAEDLFRVNTGHWLIPTAEMSLTNLVADSILDASELPLRFTSLSPCFRSEAGSAGRDTRGLIRQHQFWKVELVSITSADQSNAEHERMTSAAETILRRLELPYRRMLLCSGDMGFSARKTYDLEVWLPAQATYREISSCSNCGDFQARRMKARYRPQAGAQPEMLHTLNGSGVAVGRCLIAVMENYQNPDGSISIPTLLQPYMGGLERINAK